MLKGTKRKREKLEEGTDLPQIERMLNLYIRKTKKLVKKIRLFEIQRVVKKLRATTTSIKSYDTEELKAELDCLKQTDVERIVIIALKSKFKKDKLLSSNSMIQSFLDEKVATISRRDSNTASKIMVSVDSRLLSSKLLAVEAQKVIMVLREILGDGKSVLPLAIEAETSHSYADTQNRSTPSELNNISISDDLEEDYAHNNEDEENAEKMDHNVTESVVQKKANIYSAEHAVPNSDGSRFLPSLSVGFVDPDSGSEYSDIEAVSGDGVRKNRRGQRARKAIWEKKYGKNANHLRKQRDEMKKFSGAGLDINAGWRSKRAKDDQRKGIRHAEVANIDKRLLPGPSAHTKSDSFSDKPLHPSWEAKKRLKEKESAAIMPSQGTRLVFD